MLPLGNPFIFRECVVLCYRTSVADGVPSGGNLLRVDRVTRFHALALGRGKRLDWVEGRIRAGPIDAAAASDADVAEQIVVLLHATKESILSGARIVDLLFDT